MAKQSSERSHSRAKHKARWRRPESEQTYEDDSQQAAWRKDYYRGPRKDIDPQSNASWLLEQVGLDQPYRDDADSFDYRNKQWYKSVQAGNPDLSWFLPIGDETAGQIARVPRDFLEAVAGGSQRDRVSSSSYVRAILTQELGREPTDDEVTDFMAAIGDDDLARQNARDTLGRDPTDEEWAAWLKATTDPRTRDEKMAGAALTLNPLEFFGLSDEAAAAAGWLFGKDYDEELKKARAIQQRYDAYEDPWGARNVAANAGQIGGALGGPVFGSIKAFETGVRGLRGAAGLSPEATSLLGRATSKVAAGAPAGATDLTTIQLGSAEGDIGERFNQIDPALTIGGAIGGGVIAPLIGAGASKVVKGAKKAVSIPSKLIKKLKKPKPQPGTPRGPFGDEPAPQWPRPGMPKQPLTAATGTPRWRVSDRKGVRNDINRAMGLGPGGALVGGAGLSGAALYGIENHRQKKARKGN